MTGTNNICTTLISDERSETEAVTIKSYILHKERNYLFRRVDSIRRSYPTVHLAQRRPRAGTSKQFNVGARTRRFTTDAQALAILNKLVLRAGFFPETAFIPIRGDRVGAQYRVTRVSTTYQSSCRRDAADVEVHH